MPICPPAMCASAIECAAAPPTTPPSPAPPAAAGASNGQIIVSDSRRRTQQEQPSSPFAALLDAFSGQLVFRADSTGVYAWALPHGTLDALTAHSPAPSSTSTSTPTPAPSSPAHSPLSAPGGATPAPPPAAGGAGGGGAAAGAESKPPLAPPPIPPRRLHAHASGSKANPADKDNALRILGELQLQCALGC